MNEYEVEQAKIQQIRESLLESLDKKTEEYSVSSENDNYGIRLGLEIAKKNVELVFAEYIK